MNVIGHGGSRNQAITLAIEMKRGILDDPGDLGLPQPAISRSCIKASRSPSAMGPPMSFSFRTASARRLSDSQELRCFRQIEVLQVTSGVSAFRV